MVLLLLIRGGVMAHGHAPVVGLDGGGRVSEVRRCRADGGNFDIRGRFGFIGKVVVLPLFVC
jgi:hypothetical protein